ncbi:MAG: AraC family transcriptional regulator, partial [Planctomycetota bacterium]
MQGIGHPRQTAEVPLGTMPRLVNIGIATHGQRPVERYRLTRLWSLHFYRYKAGLRVDDVDLSIRPGTVTLLPPDVETTYRFRGKSEHVYAHLQFDNAGRQPTQVLPWRLTPPTFDTMDEAMRQAVGWWASTPRRAEVRVWDVLWQLASSPTATQPRGDVVDRLRSAIERQLAEPLRVSALLDELDLGYTHNHVLRLFKARTGRTIAGHIRTRRVERAMHLLRNT